MVLKKVHDLAFGPSAVVSVGLGKKRAVAAMSGFEQRDVRVGQYLGARFR
jgi:hypothetical protein